MKRIAIFVFYDAEGVADSYIADLLSGIRPYVERIVAVCNGSINLGKENIDDYSDEVIVRPNEGYDAGAYKDVILGLVKTGMLSEYDRLILFNDTVYGFFYPLSEMFRIVESDKEVDMWGMTEHSGIGEHKGRALSWHLQGYFLIINKRLLQSRDFAAFWESLCCPKTYTEAIFAFEIGLSKYLIERGYTLKSIYAPEKMGIPKDNNFGNLYFSHAYELVVKVRCPVLKVKSIENMSGLEALKYLEKNTSYDPSNIWEHYRRRIRNKNVGNDAYDIDALCDFCKKHRRIYIYGNGVIGKRIYDCIVDKGYSVTGFIVTKRDKSYDDVYMVYELGEIRIDEECGVIIGMRKQYRKEVMENVLKMIDKPHIFMPVS